MNTHTYIHAYSRSSPISSNTQRNATQRNVPYRKCFCGPPQANRNVFYFFTHRRKKLTNHKCSQPLCCGNRLTTSTVLRYSFTYQRQNVIKLVRIHTERLDEAFAIIIVHFLEQFHFAQFQSFSKYLSYPKTMFSLVASSQ